MYLKKCINKKNLNKKTLITFHETLSKKVFINALVVANLYYEYSKKYLLS